jgi:uncharacterized protein YaaQ
VNLIVCIIHRDDADNLMTALMGIGQRATRLSTTGGFLREGNATILIGVDEPDVPKALEVIKANTRAHTIKNPTRRRPQVKGEVVFSAATVFVLDLNQIQRV